MKVQVVFCCIFCKMLSRVCTLVRKTPLTSTSFFTRNRVGIEDAESVGDLQRTDNLWSTSLAVSLADFVRNLLRASPLAKWC